MNRVFFVCKPKNNTPALVLRIGQEACLVNGIIAVVSGFILGIQDPIGGRIGGMEDRLMDPKKCLGRVFSSLKRTYEQPKPLKMAAMPKGSFIFQLLILGECVYIYIFLDDKRKEITKNSLAGCLEKL